jgi:hypothetical protein
MAIEQSCRAPAASAVADWACLGDEPPRATKVVAADHDMAYPALRSPMSFVSRHASPYVTDEIRAEASRPTRIGEDHQTRTRCAWLLNCPPPDDPPKVSVSLSDQRLAHAAAQIIAAVGPLPMADLIDAVRGGYRRNRVITADQLAEALTRTSKGQVNTSGQWTHNPEIEPIPTYRELARASGREVHTTSQSEMLLTDAGYTNASGTTLYGHPLLEHLSRNAWRIRGRGDHREGLPWGCG